MAHHQTRALGDLCDVLDSKRKPVTKKDRRSGEYPYYGATGVLDYVDDYIFDEPLVLVGEDGAKWGAGENTAFSVVGRCWVNNHAHVLRPRRNIATDKWIIYYLNANDLSPFITGLTVPKLNQAKLREIQIPVPPLPEQKRIVAILDEAFEGISTAVANAEKSFASARELFDSYLNSIFAQKGEGWIEKKLEDTVEKTCSLSYGIVQPGEDVSGGLPIVRPTDLQSKTIHLDGLKRIDPALADGYKRTKLHGGELLLCVRGGTGSVSIAAKELAGSNVTRGIVPIRFDPASVIQEFGYFAFISKGVQEQIRAATYGAALMQINIRDLRKVSLNLPSLTMQKSLLEGLNNISAEVEGLASLYKQKAAALLELKQAILQKAFAGELTARSAEAVQEAAE